jgi:hypothetical protein
VRGEGSSERAKLSESISRLWDHLFRADDAVVHAHVLRSFTIFVQNTTLASDGVNVVEQSVPLECKAQFVAMLSARPDASLSSALPRLVWNEQHPREPARRQRLQQHCTLGALSSTVAVDGSSVAGVSGNTTIKKPTGAKWAAVERDCSALELVLPRVEAAMLKQRPSPEVAARLLALAGTFERMRASLVDAA